MGEQTPFIFDIPKVSELTDKIKILLEQNFTDILVEGESSNVKQSRNGHIYFTLKDDDAQLPCVIWRSVADRLDVQLTDGQQLVLGGDIQVYAPHGRYQMIVSLVQKAGIGKLQQAFEQLKEKLKAEGLFDEIHKKPLPEFPMKIGVVTSATSAAFQDIKSTLMKRWPLATIYLYHASVQGENAVPEIVKGINFFSDRNNVDILMIGRGGGSLEDLWAFNEEAVARAVFGCKVPIISGVGHEVDFSISDFVADARAATPTHCVVIATPDINDVRVKLEDYTYRLEKGTSGSIDLYKEKVQRLAKSHALMAVQHKMQRAGYEVRQFSEQLSYLTEKKIQVQKEHIVQLIHRLEQENPNTPLEKGFVRVWQNDQWVRKAEQFNESAPVDLEWKEKKISLS